jgi:hypothetical protein
MNQVTKEYGNMVQGLQGTIRELEVKLKNLTECADLMAECLDNANHSEQGFRVAMEALRRYLTWKEQR